MRDLATHHVHGIASNPAKWATRVKYTSGFRAGLAAFLLDASTTLVLKAEEQGERTKKYKGNEPQSTPPPSQPITTNAEPVTTHSTHALPSAAMSAEHVNLMKTFASCKGNVKGQPEFGAWAAGVFAKAAEKAEQLAEKAEHLPPTTSDGGGRDGGDDAGGGGRRRVDGGGGDADGSDGNGGGSFSASSSVGDGKGKLTVGVPLPSPSAAELQQYFDNTGSNLVARQLFALEVRHTIPPAFS